MAWHTCLVEHCQISSVVALVLVVSSGHRHNTSCTNFWFSAGPRIGDTQFCQMLADNYPQQTFRYVHAADIIPKVPPRFLLYAHFPREIFLSSFGQLVLKTEDIARWHTIEAWGYLFIQLQKTFGNLIRFRESPVRTIYRLALLISIPGLSDHFPQDYEQLLRDQVKASSEKHTPITWSRNKQLSRVQQIVTGV